MKRLLIIALLTFGLLLVGTWFLLPVIAERVILRSIKEAGFESPEIDRLRVGFNSSELAGLRMAWPDGVLGLESLRLAYSVPVLLGGSVENIVISGLFVDWMPASGESDLRENNTEKPEEKMDGLENFRFPEIPGLPFHLLIFDSARFNWGKREAMAASLFVRSVEDRIEAAGAIPGFGTRIHLLGRHDQNQLQEVDAYLSTVDVGHWIAWAQGPEMDSIPLQGGQLDFGLSLVESENGGEVGGTLRAELRNFGIPTISSDSDGHSLSLEVNALPRKYGWDLHLEAIDQTGGITFSGVHFVRNHGPISGDGWMGFGPSSISEIGWLSGIGGDGVGISLGGEIAMVMQSRLAGERFSLGGIVSIENGTFGLDSVARIVHGFRGQIGIEILPRFRTLGLQKFYWDGLSYDRFSSGPGEVEWELRDGRQFTLQTLEQNLLGGVLELDSPVHLDLVESGRNFDAGLHVRRIDLAKLADACGLDQIEAVGRMSGRVRLAAVDGKFTKMEAGLDLDTGQEASIKFTDQEWLRRAIGGGQSDILVQAVSDLRLQSLHLEVFALRTGQPNTFIRIQGSSQVPNIKAPEINLDLKFQIPFEKIYQLILLGKRISLSGL
tara:strand:+ start:7495 stop:9321 length:1827 start_codon:yes stop_codon:yes gene_type:complete